MQIFCKIVAFVIILCVIIIVRSPREGNLRQVYVIFRHGQRSPTQAYPYDPHRDYPWPGGWGELTLLGKQHVYHLGEKLRERYESFLGKYDRRFVRVESSYADRCLMSAQLVLAGLFPPQGDEIWNNALLWQPIPVHSLPRELDNKIAMKKTCKNFLKALNERYESLANLNRENRELYDYLSKHSGDEIRNILSVESLYNTLEIEQLQGLTLPDWTEGVFPAKMVSLATRSLAIFTDTTQMKRLHGGVLMAEILMNIETMKKGMILYSGHDLTVLSLLRLLGGNRVFIKPEFGASLIIEVYNEPEGPIVKFFYKSNPYSERSRLNLETCENTNCTLPNLYQLLTPVIPVNWEAECNAD